MSGDVDSRGVAIVGLACRFPGANDAKTFWTNLCDGVDSIRHFDDGELLKNGISSRDLKRDDYVKASPIIDDIDRFDAGFFEYSPREARLMDPQQRLLLEIAWHAFEDAGYIPGEIASRVGAFVGSGGVVSSYLLAQQALHGGTTGGIEHLANDKDFLSTKLSYKLGLTGPSINVQTACSTALVATHMACQSILDGECEMAIAGASVVRVPHISGYTYRPGDILSPDGKCRAYDANAEGTVFGSGAGVVVLKHVEDALADGDRIYAVILGSAVNNDGAEKLSYTASSTSGQQRAMDAAFAAAEVPPSTIGYVEGHGTGTVVGDPLEVEALRRCFAADANSTIGGCYLGSVKTNIGHLEQAAGIASLIKTTLSLHHGKVPQSLNFETPNPRMNLDQSPFVVPTQTEDWIDKSGPNRAAVNSLGLGGTNAFAVLQQAPAAPRAQGGSAKMHVLPLSASSPSALNLAVNRWADYLAGATEVEELTSICFTAAIARKQLKHRIAVCGQNSQGLIEELAQIKIPATSSGKKTKLAFLFPGQGAQTADMGRSFYESDLTFRTTFDGVAKRLLEKFELDITSAVFAPEGDELLNHTSITQPALFAVEWSLVAMLRNWGLRPDAVLGHSVGAYAAAVAAGIYSPETATDLIAHRARLMGDLPSGGTMCAMFADTGAAQKICDQLEGVSVATMNSPLSTVIAGSEPAVTAAMSLANEADIICRQLPVSHAFHSPLMQPAVAPFQKQLEQAETTRPNLAFVSDMTGEIMTDAPEPAYLAQHIVQPVNFAKAIKQLRELGCTDFIEVGPGTALRSFVAASGEPNNAATNDIGREHVYGLLDEGGDEVTVAAKTLGRLWERGYQVDFGRFYGPCDPPRTDIPYYQFDRQRYWIDEPTAAAARGTQTIAGAEVRLPGVEPIGIAAAARNFQSTFTASSPDWLEHHRVYGEVTLPVVGALIGFMEAAATAGHGGGPIEIGDLTYQQACLFSDETSQVLNFEVRLDQSTGNGKLQGFSTSSKSNTMGSEGQWITHCEASLRPLVVEPVSVGNLDSLRQQHGDEVQPSTYYQALDQLGLNYGPGFRNVRKLYVGLQSALGLVSLAPDMPETGSAIHPALLDACLHLFPAATGEYGNFQSLAEGLNTTYLPISVEKFALYRDVPDRVWSHCRVRPDDHTPGERYCVDIDIYAEDGTPVAALLGLTVKLLAREEFLPAEHQTVAPWLYGVDWVACSQLAEVTAPPRPLSSPQPSSSPPQSPPPPSPIMGHWLVVAAQEADVAPVVEAMHARDQSWELISPERLLQQDEQTTVLASLNQPLAGIINASALSLLPQTLLSPADLQRESKIQFDLSQAILKLTTETLAGADIQPKIWYLTRGAQAPLDTHLGGEALQSVLWGHGRAIAQEHPNVWGGLIDIDHQTDGYAILRELMVGDDEDQIALRDGVRYGPRLVRRFFDVHTGPVQPPVDPQRSYLVTGGLGALGLKVANWLVVEQGARHLWLVSRRKPDQDSKTEIDGLEQLGATVHIVSTDVSDLGQVNRLMDQISDHGPALDGVFHCAGLLDDGIMIEMDWDRYHRVTAAKVEGSWALHLATESMKLGHFVLFSSILSVIGSMGQLNYVSGNSFLDGLVSYRRRLGLAAAALNWGPWENAGLAVESGERGEAIWRARGTKFIPVEIGLQAMNSALLNQQGHLVVTHTDWSRFVSQFSKTPRLYEKLTDAQSGSGRRLLDDLGSTLTRIGEADPDDRNSLLVSAVDQICCVNLELEASPDLDLSLREVGLDSLMSITVINDVESIFGIRLAARQLLKGPSVSELAGMIRLALPSLFGTDGVDRVEDPADFLKAEGSTLTSPANRPASPNVVQSGSWLVVQRPRPNARLRLICFPFAGGGSAVFDDWGDQFAPDIEIVSVEAPGRLGRIDEEPVRTIEQFARGLYPELRPKLDRPYAMLGHCLGGLTLYEMLRFFEAQRDPMPEHVFVSGARPPSVLRAPGSFEAELNERLTSYAEYKAGSVGYQQPDEVFAEIVRAFGISESSKMLEVEELRQLVLPTVRAEFEMTSRYVYLPERPFSVPITCFRGQRDAYFNRAHAGLWEKFTTAGFELFERDTGHFAIVEDFDFIRSIIESRLSPSNAASA